MRYRRAKAVERTVVGAVATGGRVEHLGRREPIAAGYVARVSLRGARRIIGVVRRRDVGQARGQPEPQRDEAGVDVAAVEGHVAVGVGHRHVRPDRLDRARLALLHPQRVLLGHEERGDAHVGRPVHADLAVGPLLRLDPVEDLGVVVLGALTPRVPAALARAGAAVVHDHDRDALVEQRGVAAGERAVGAAVEPERVVRVLVVARDGQHHGEAPFRPGQEDVPAQGHAVAHLDRCVADRGRLRARHGGREQSGEYGDGKGQAQSSHTRETLSYRRN